MVRQFADPYAFLRELVQNGIDAGATAIDVHIERMGGGQIATSVSDDGCGMTRAIIEGPLLTLFSSTKEGDTQKIGKYGVGFVSIFALDPDEVQVSTGRDGESWLLRLFRDHSYELEVGGPRVSSGTKVTLLTKLPEAKIAEEPSPPVKPPQVRKPQATTQEQAWQMDTRELLERASDMLAAALDQAGPALSPPEPPQPPEPAGMSFEEHAGRVQAALLTWCRHAQCPITLTVVDPTSPEPRRQERIDTPLAVAATVSVIESSEGEVIVAGVSEGMRFLPSEADAREPGASFAGFYNRGLTLFETDQALSKELRGVHFKIMSPHLKHTLSRDNVRRDEAFERLIKRAKAIVAGPLQKRAIAEVARGAERAAKGEEVARYTALLEAALSPALAIKPKAITFPLTDPLPVSGEQTASDFSAHLSRGQPLLTATDPDELTAALARVGTIVVRCPNDPVRRALRLCSKYPVEEAHKLYALVREVEPSEVTTADKALCDEVRGATEDAGQRVSRVGFARLEGAAAALVAIVVPDGEPNEPRVYDFESIRSWWKRWTRRRALLLNVEAETIVVARQKAMSDPAIAGHLLARSLMLRGGESIPAGANEDLLARAGRAMQ